jgi:pimeloyl-ACP methyl ester carboxylesterase
MVGRSRSREGIIEAMLIEKHFVSVGTRRVHYLRAGAGPALVLLHASACSAKVMRPLIEVFAERFTVIAPDSPGFGLSDKLSIAQPSIADLADGVADFLTALSIAQAALYGRHTGASIAAEFAVRHPSRCAMVLTDGYAILSGDYDESKIADYLRPIAPTWDGAHLTWLWFRYRDQHAFWPWNAQTIETRAEADIPDLDFLHRGVVEFLEAGNDYRLPYAAAFRYNAIATFERLTVPVCFGVRRGDWMYKMLPLYPKSAWVQEMPRDALEAALFERATLEKHPAKGTVPPAPACAPLPNRATTDYVRAYGMQLLVRRWGEIKPGEPPIVIVPALPGSSALYEPLMARLGAHRTVIAFDPPGHGESDALPENEQSIAAWTRALTVVVDVLGIDRVHLYGHQSGAAVALAFAVASSGRVASLTLDAPIGLSERERDMIAPHCAPSIEPSWEGAHLLRAWHHLRDQELWWPWFERGHRTIKTTAPRIDPAALTLRVREVIKQPASYAPAWQVALEDPMLDRLLGATTLASRTLMFAAPEDVFVQGLRRALMAMLGAGTADITDDPASRAAAILAHIEQ